MFSVSTSLFLLSGTILMQNKILGLPWWVWLIVLALIVIVVLLVALQDKPKEETAEVMEEIQEDTGSVKEAAPVEEDTSPVQDLTRIEGIGPKINATLQQKGITTFQKLAETSVEDLQKILDEFNLRLADPATWPQQSELAAAGKWDELQKLQDELKGGRQVE